MLSNTRSVTRKEKFILMAAVSVITAQSEDLVILGQGLEIRLVLA